MSIQTHKQLILNTVSPRIFGGLLAVTLIPFFIQLKPKRAHPFIQEMRSSFENVTLLYHNNLLCRQSAYFDEVHARGWHVKASLMTSIHFTANDVVDADFVF